MLKRKFIGSFAGKKILFIAYYNDYFFVSDNKVRRLTHLKLEKTL